MATISNEARIKVTLDVAKARRQLEDLKKELRGARLTVADKTTLDREQKERAVDIAKRTEEAKKEIRKEEASAKSKVSLGAVLGASLLVARTIETVVPPVTTALVAGAEAIPAAPFSGALPFDQLARKVDEIAKALSDRISELAARVSAVRPAFERAKHWTVARTVLGGASPSITEMLADWGDFQEVYRTLNQSDRQKQKILKEIVSQALANSVLQMINWGQGN